METMKKKMSEIAWVEWSVPARETVYEEAVSELGLDYLDYPDWVLDDIKCSDGIYAESYKIVPDAEPDVEKYPIPALESIKTGYSRTIMSNLDPQEFSMRDMSEKFYQALCQLKDVWPHPRAIEQLRIIAGKLSPLLNDAKKLGDKKVSLAKRMGLMEVAANIERAYKTFCMIELTGDIHVDSEQLFIIHKVDPDDLRTAMCSAFKLDRDATEILNSYKTNEDSNSGDIDGFNQNEISQCLKSIMEGQKVLQNTVNEAKNEAAKAASNTEKTKRKNRERAKGVTNKWIASVFDEYKLPLVRGRKKDGKLVYEKNQNGTIYYVGRCSTRTVEQWLIDHPNEGDRHPISGFHAGMLKNQNAIKKSAENWGNYYNDYVQDFFEWRKTNQNARREDFRYKPHKTEHRNNL